MWNPPSKKDLENIPRLYKTENTPTRDKIIHMHLFVGGCDWYIAECDGKDIMFGYTILNGDYMNSEWGYISLEELKEIKIGPSEIYRDLFWEVRTAKEIDKIVKGGGI